MKARSADWTKICCRHILWPARGTKRRGKKEKRNQGTGKREGDGSAAEGVQLPRGGDVPFQGGVQDDGAALCGARGGDGEEAWGEDVVY